jgi:hypothetical protein
VDGLGGGPVTSSRSVESPASSDGLAAMLVLKAAAAAAVASISPLPEPERGGSSDCARRGTFLAEAALAEIWRRFKPAANCSANASLALALLLSFSFVLPNVGRWRRTWRGTAGFFGKAGSGRRDAKSGMPCLGTAGLGRAGGLLPCCLGTAHHSRGGSDRRRRRHVSSGQAGRQM